MWGWLTALVRGLADSFLGWYSAYNQGRNAEQAASAKASARQAGAISDAQAATRDVTVDDAWLHRGSSSGQAPVVSSTAGTAGPR